MGFSHMKIFNLTHHVISVAASPLVGFGYIGLKQRKQDSTKQLSPCECLPLFKQQGGRQTALKVFYLQHSSLLLPRQVAVVKS